MVRDPTFTEQLEQHFDAAVAASREVGVGVPRPGGFWSLLRRGFVAWVAYVYLRVAGVTGRY